MEDTVKIESINAFCGHCGATNRIDISEASTKTPICGKCEAKLTSSSEQTPAIGPVTTSQTIGFWQSFALASIGLVALKYGMDLIVDPSYRRYALYLLIVIVVFNKTIWTLVLKAALFLLLISTVVFFWSNKNALLQHKITVSDGVTQIWRIFTGYGPVQNFEKQISVSKYKTYVDAIDVRNQEINNLASRLTSDCLNGDLGCQAQKIALFVSTEINYRLDPISGGEYIKQPLQTYSSGAGDCEDKTILLSSLLGSIGIPTVLVFEKGHVYPRACFEKQIKSNYLDSDNVWKMGNKFCYDIETTDKWSGLGVSKDDKSKIKAIVDVKTKQLF